LSEGTFTPAEPQPQKQPSSLPFHLPADYYAAPAGVRPLFPRWVPMGCGIAAALLILVMFIGGAVVSRGGVGRVMDFFMGTMQREMPGLYAPDVPAESRRALELDLDSLRANIRAERVPLARLDPVMTALRQAVQDQKLTNDEVRDLRKKIQEANTSQPPKR
jgi:hypothetical protein